MVPPNSHLPKRSLEGEGLADAEKFEVDEHREFISLTSLPSALCKKLSCRLFWTSGFHYTSS